MKKFLLLFGLIVFSVSVYADEQVYFKIAIGENAFSTFLNNRSGFERPTASYLAAKMREITFDPAGIDKAYYNISSIAQMRFAGRNVRQYDIRPKHADRFRQVLMIDLKDGDVIHKDIYDTKGRLVFSFTSLDPEETDEKPAMPDDRKMNAPSKGTKCLNGFCVVGVRTLRDGTKHIMLSDGLNKFSIFSKNISMDVPVSKKIIYGNYVMRKKVGGQLFTVVGTVPFKEMEYMIDNYSSLEDK